MCLRTGWTTCVFGSYGLVTKSLERVEFLGEVNLRPEEQEKARCERDAVHRTTRTDYPVFPALLPQRKLFPALFPALGVALLIILEEV